MEQYLFLKGYRVAKFYGPIDPKQLPEARRNFYYAHIGTTIIPKPPHERTLRKWKQKGIMKAIDGCLVNGACSCVHGNRSWLGLFDEVKKMKSKS